MTKRKPVRKTTARIRKPRKDFEGDDTFENPFPERELEDDGCHETKKEIKSAPEGSFRSLVYRLSNSNDSGS